MVPDYKRSCQKLRLHFHRTNYHDVEHSLKNTQCFYCNAPWHFGHDLMWADTQSFGCTKCGFKLLFRDRTPFLNDTKSFYYSPEFILNSVQYKQMVLTWIGSCFPNGKHNRALFQIKAADEFDLQTILNRMNMWSQNK